MVPGAAGFHLVSRTSRVVRSGKRGVVGHVDNGERAARCSGLVGTGVVEGAAVVEGNAAGFHVHGHRLGHVVALFLHFTDDTLASNAEFNRFEPLVLV